MEKIQILFPEPQMRRLRELARLEDRPISEVVRRAVEAWLERQPPERRSDTPTLPIFHGGSVRIPSDHLRDAAFADRLRAQESAQDSSGSR